MQHSQPIIEHLNRQIHAELTSFYRYLGMAAFCDAKKFHGAAHWLRLQSQEEHGHAMRLYDFLVSRDSPVELRTLDDPTCSYTDILEVFQAALTQEREISEKINQLFKVAISEGAYTTSVELQWFLTEQIEEEKTIRDLVHQLTQIKNDPAALLEWDNRLGSRTLAE